jgi:hypothetical protein
MHKAILRLTIIAVAIYFIVCYLFAQLFGIDLLRSTYVLLFELCLVLIVFNDNSKYFCKFIKWTMLSILVSDTVTHLDYYLNFLTVSVLNYFCAFVLCIGFGTSCTLAIRHFIQVIKIKKRRNESRQLIANETGGTITS